MQTMSAGYRGASLLLQLNWDRLLFAAAIVGALLGAGALGSLIG